MTVVDGRGARRLGGSPPILDFNPSEVNRHASRAQVEWSAFQTARDEETQTSCQPYVETLSLRLARGACELRQADRAVQGARKGAQDDFGLLTRFAVERDQPEPTGRRP